MLSGFLLFIIICAALTLLVLSSEPFGRKPSGKRLERIRKSPNYRGGKFVNAEPTRQISEDASLTKLTYDFFFKKDPDLQPRKAFRFAKADLSKIQPWENIYVWMGHSSYFLQADGKKILADPVFSGYASPFSFTTNAFASADLYRAEDIPELDILLITHDHWDHLDYKTVKKLFPKSKKIVTGLGTGAHLEFWGCDPSKIIELDWGESHDFGGGYQIFCETARHFSGRGLQRDRAIWASFLFKTPLHKIYLGGDSGYGAHFKNIGEKHSGIDLAILENGQYNRAWRYIHMLPGEQQQAAKDLKARRLIPVHNSKFALALHSWQEPLEEMYRRQEDLRILFPKIGEKVFWQDDAVTYEKWWERPENFQ